MVAVIESAPTERVEAFKREQGQLFALERTGDEQAALARQLQSFPPPETLRKLFAAAMAEDSTRKTSGEFAPPEETDVADGTQRDEDWSRWHATGMAALRAGECAVVTLAGGQGTRLGSTRPKGCYSLGLPSGASLFEIQAGRIRRLEMLCGSRVPWYIMTSEPTHADTVEFFEKNDYFQLDRGQVVFFQQGVLPAFTVDGDIVLAERGRVSVAPDGNGGIYRALARSGVLDALQGRGVCYVHMYCVDNCLVKVGDPAFFGVCIERNADCAAKCVDRADPAESVGVFARREGRLVVAEYSELDGEMARAIDPHTGQLRFRAANVANHFFTVAFLREMAAADLPYHIARKRIPAVDPQTGKAVTVAGIKLEAFIFDVFERAARPLLFRVVRSDEFAPLKNAPGSASDAPEHCAALLYALHRRYLQDAGAVVSTDGPLEISPLLSYEGEGLEGFAGRVITENLLQ